ncbi:dihydrofolate reductase family protein [Streptomyces indicus]|uniref:Dihydrofolate reductase n=1 Tax=Streptomyces indicus TaxID=417292 RepID=A0A1G9IZU1_9ACTN|nr:dihydrofolate reductase family protein [Streptomyces indicus]SDL30720.1 Dihydrofolate reductase [Streptomyces indicus]
MRKLVYYIAVTLDGQIAGPDGSDPTSGPDAFWPIADDYLQHLAAEFPETLPAPAREALGITAPGTRFDTVLEGRRTYQLGVDAGVPDAYPHLRHLVFSRTLTQSPAPSVELVAEDPVETVRRLKKEDGKDIWLIGGGELAGALYGEIDQLILKLAPLTVGTGIPLFGTHARFEPTAFTLTDSKILESGSAFLTYTRKEQSS